MVIEELRRPKGAPASDLRRLAVNWGLGIANAGFGVLVPLGALAAAALARGGPLADMSPAAAFLPLLVARSLAAYWQHRLLHLVPWLWRIHRVHHSDRDMDSTTGLRNHPLELLVTVAVAGAVILALSPPLAAVAAVDALLFAAALWQHAAIPLPDRPARWLERVIVTPRLHLVHHARARELHDRNFGDLLSVWDRLFGTFTAPVAESLAIGLADQGQRPDSLPGQLLAPFRA